MSYLDKLIRRLEKWHGYNSAVEHLTCLQHTYIPNNNTQNCQ